MGRLIAVASRISNGRQEKQSFIAVAVAVAVVLSFLLGFGRSLENRSSSSIASPSCGSVLPYIFSFTVRNYVIRRTKKKKGREQ